MFLKSIEIRGFKSFADKTELVFKKGITAIVGPNGSGKSNISDAVRWVLGEQSVKTLRGSKMEDIIFAGTQYRKSVSLCQVSLILDNSDKKLPIEYAEIIISRRLYRSGESEYYLNNTKCRLKDIQELFMDTGIGKEGYSIIGQGKIDRVLSGKPEERRGLLEEAAGIVKFKIRKQDASKRLENTDKNLIRINDILTTYSERVEPLKKECDKAKEFLDLSKKLKEKEVNIIIKSIDELNNKLNDISNSYKFLSEEKSTLEKDIYTYKNKVDEFTQKIEKLQNTNSLNKDTYFNNKSKIQNIEHENLIFDEKIKNLNFTMNEKEEKINLNKKKIKEYLESITLLNDKIQQLNLKKDVIKSESDVIKKKLSNFSEFINSKENKLKKLKLDQIEILSSISNSKNQIIVFENDKKNLNNKCDNLKSSCKEYTTLIENNLKNKQQIKLNIDALNNSNVELYDELEKNQKQINSMKITLESLEKQLQKITTQVNKLEANFQMLSNLENQYEGYNKSVKTLMKHINDGRISDIKDNFKVLGDVISVDKDFELAIEIALGGTISNVITKDEDVAKCLINYLKNNNIGRATFLPLTIIKGKSLNVSLIKNEKGFLGIASEIVKFDSKFINIVKYVLGRTIIVDDMNTALKIAKKLNYSCKIVTLDGQVVNPGGSLTGGSIKSKISTSIISRKREIEEIQKLISYKKNKISKLTNFINEYRENIKRLDKDNLNIKDDIYVNKIEITKFEEKLKSIIEDTKRLNKILSVSKEEIIIINKDISKLEDSIKKFNKKLNELKNKNELNDKTIDDYELDLLSEREGTKDLQDNLTKFKIENIHLEENLSSKIKEVKDKQTFLKELDDENKEFSIQISNDHLKLKELNNNINKNSLNIIDLKKKTTQLKQELEKYDVEYIKIKQQLDNFKSKEESLVLILNNKQNDIHKKDIVIAKYNAERESFYKKLNEEYSLTYAQGIEYKKEIKNIHIYKSDINKIKNKISNLGTVNLGAITEYKQLKEKITFMAEQREDLVKSKEELNNVIDEMTVTMKKVFSENFNKLRVHFNETFKQLFKGGSADLILRDGDELTSNIDINVQPPGKKLQNINLMSGGEKGLSAIALLFAILKMKPTPFCILDEIEAALDDFNVKKYGDFLNKFSNEIQFIVITHRKGTMTVADVLYGVTMKEKGISKIISLNLDSKKEVASTL